MTKEEIKAQSREYMDKVKAEDKEYGYDRSNLTYADIKRSFEDGALWCQSEIAQRCVPVGGCIGERGIIDTEEAVKFVSKFVEDTSRMPSIEDFIIQDRKRLVRAKELIERHLLLKGASEQIVNEVLKILDENGKFSS